MTLEDCKKTAHALKCKLYRRDKKIAELEEKINNYEKLLTTTDKKEVEFMEKYELLCIQSSTHQSKYHAEIRTKKAWRTTTFLFAGLWVFTLILAVIKL